MSEVFHKLLLTSVLSGCRSEPERLTALLICEQVDANARE